MMFLLALPEGMGMMNAAVTPLLLGAAPREYVGRVAAVFTPVDQIAACWPPWWRAAPNDPSAFPGGTLCNRTRAH
jgi:hypothetical protein